MAMFDIPSNQHIAGGKQINFTITIPTQDISAGRQISFVATLMVIPNYAQYSFSVMALVSDNTISSVGLVITRGQDFPRGDGNR